jgi:hypothetical protein
VRLRRRQRGAIVCVLFGIEYVNVVSGSVHSAVGVWQMASYISAELLAVSWGIYFIKAARRGD